MDEIQVVMTLELSEIVKIQPVRVDVSVVMDMYSRMEYVYILTCVQVRNL